MWLDIVTVIIAILAFIHGARKGFILSLCTLAAWIIGIAVAITFCSAFSQWLDNTFNLHGALIPIIAFIVLLLLVHFIIIQIGVLLEKLISALFLGWLSRFLGGVLQTVIYLCILSIVFYFMKQGGILSENTISQSRIYPLIEPWGVYFVQEIASLWPAFQKQILNLEDLLRQLANKMENTK